LVLVALDVEYVNGHGEIGDNGADGLKDVVVRSKEVEGGGEIIDWALDVLDDGFVVNGDG
jgi:hypothetical protein